MKQCMGSQWRYIQHVFGGLQNLDVSNCHCNGSATIGPNARLSVHSASKLELLVNQRIHAICYMCNTGDASGKDFCMLAGDLIGSIVTCIVELPGSLRQCVLWSVALYNALYSAVMHE